MGGSILDPTRTIKDRELGQFREKPTKRAGDKKHIEDRKPKELKRKRRGIFRRLFTLLLLFFAAYAGGGFVGAFTNELEHSTWPSSEQRIVYLNRGQPARWIVADDNARRYEQWTYWDEGEIYHFIDGKLILQERSQHSNDPFDGTNVKPSDFDRWMSLETVETIVGHKSVLMPHFAEEGYEARYFEKARLLVLFRDGYFRGALVI